MKTDEPISPKIFAIILGWNSRDDTLECLSSFKDHLFPNWQIVLVDNASTDNTVATVRAQFPNVHIIENKCNLGYAEGNNVGIRYALEQDAKYVFLLNNDTIVPPSTLKQLLEVAEANSNIGILCPRIISYHDHSRQYVGARILWENGVGVEIERSPEGLPEFLETDYAPGCALLIRSRVIREIGLLASDFFAYFEDVDWSLRCRQAGYRVVVVPQAAIFHKGTMDQSDRKSATAEFYFRRNQFLFMRKYGRWHHWLPFLKFNLRKSLERFQRLVQEDENEIASALLDGWWAGVTGKFGAQRIHAPAWFKNLVRRQLGLLLWLTGWLYFWEYQKVKRQKAKESQTSA